MARPGYVVLNRTDDGGWAVVAEVDRRPGLPARRSRTAAVVDALGRPPDPAEEFRVLPRSEWRLGADL
jgi:hypothetical protein